MLRFCAIAALAVCASHRLAAQTADSTRLPRVVITATRLETRIGSDIPSVTVLEGDSLRARGISDLAEALREVPGAVIVRSGSAGAQTSLFMRGGESDYVRVLVDGVPMNEPGGSIDLASYTLDNVERVEIVRGPASVLYGSDAVAGVIQIFTTRVSSPLHVEGSVTGGSYATRSADVTLGGASATLSASVGAAVRESEGILEFNNAYDNRILSARVGTARAGFRGRLTARHHDDEFHYPTDGAGRVIDRNAFRTDRRSAVAIDASQRIGSRLEFAVSLTGMEGRPRTEDARDSASDTAGFHAYTSAGSVRRRAADTRVNVLLPGDVVTTVGYEWQREAQRGRDSSNFDAAPNTFRAERTTRAAYTQVVADAGQLSVTFGARYDDNDVFGRFRTARGGFSWRVRTGLTLRASAGSAFKAPTFIEQFNTAFTIGNPALRPERSHGVETGITQIFASGRGELSGTWFSQRFRDMIQYTFIDANAPNYFNVAAASARGAEFAGRARFAGGAYLGANVVFLRTRVDDAGFDEGANATFVQGKRLLRRPSVTATLHGRVSLTPRLTADARMMHVGQRDDRDFSTFPANPVTLASYRRVDFGVTYRLTHDLPALSVFVNAENVLAARYQEVMNFRAPGRVLSIGARVVTKR